MTASSYAGWNADSGRFVAVVNQTFVRNYFINDEPIGQKFKFNVFDQIAQTPHDAYFEIVGVVSDIKNQGLRDPPMPQAYIPTRSPRMPIALSSSGRQWTRFLF